MQETSKSVDVENVLHMNGGSGESSYSNNSTLQKSLAHVSLAVLEGTIRDMYSIEFPECFRMVDFGCSSGENTYLIVYEIIKIVHDMCKENNKEIPEIQVFLNDLPSNDFNTLFEWIPAFTDKLKKIGDDDFGHCFISATPGSFYKRLFPAKSLNFMHSSISLHWLSQVPGRLESNKRNIHIGSTSPPNIVEAYQKQFEKDFSNFLLLRSKELMPNGRMVLSLIGRATADHTTEEAILILESIAKSLSHMVDEGIIKEADLHSFNLPMYDPCKQEVENIIQKNSFFTLERLEVIEVTESSDDGDIYVRAKDLANTMRAVLEALLITHFGKNLNIEKLFQRFAEYIVDYAFKTQMKYVNIVVSLSKN